MAPLYVLLGGTAALLVLGAVTGRSPVRHWPDALRRGLAAMFVVTGMSHFVGLREDLVAMVPPALPAAALMVTVTGVLELVGAAGLLWRRTAAWTAAGLAGLLVAMFPANVHAALSDVQLGGEPATALPLRAGMQVVYVAAAATVWATHRRAGAWVRTGAPRRHSSVGTVALPVAAGPAAGRRAPGVVLVSRLQLLRLRDVPGFLRASLLLRRAFRDAPGAMSLRLAASPSTGTFWTWSSWTDEGAMAGYTRSDAHREVMARYRERLQDSRFEALRPAGPTPLPRSWAEVRALVATPTRARASGHGERAKAGTGHDGHQA
ncbi:hypothetical protein ACI8AC_24970 [Geodermatophilus sp. SYSU D00758]